MCMQVLSTLQFMLLNKGISGILNLILPISTQLSGGSSRRLSMYVNLLSGGSLTATLRVSGGSWNKGT